MDTITEAAILNALAQILANQTVLIEASRVQLAYMTQGAGNLRKLELEKYVQVSARVQRSLFNTGVMMEEEKKPAAEQPEAVKPTNPGKEEEQPVSKDTSDAVSGPCQPKIQDDPQFGVIR